MAETDEVGEGIDWDSMIASFPLSSAPAEPTAVGWATQVQRDATAKQTGTFAGLVLAAVSPMETLLTERRNALVSAGWSDSIAEEMVFAYFQEMMRVLFP